MNTIAALQTGIELGQPGARIINHIGLSSGKDSTALWGWAINDAGYDPATIRGSFCDTENEYQEVYDQIDRLDEYGQKHGVPPIARLRSIGFLALAMKKKRFPSAKVRFCTQVLKMIPSRNFILAFSWLMGFDVLNHSGVRCDESTERSLMPEYDFNGFLQCQNRRPLLKWTLSDVWNAHRRYGLPINPLYGQGRHRVGCKLCCMSKKQDVRLTHTHHPETIDTYREWEQLVTVNSGAVNTYRSFFSRTTVPMAQRSKHVVSKDGKEWMIPTIDDVVRWSYTMHGGVQGGFDFMFEEDDSHLPCQSGYCE